MRTERILYGADEGTDACRLQTDSGRVPQRGLGVVRQEFVCWGAIWLSLVGIGHGEVVK